MNAWISARLERQAHASIRAAERANWNQPLSLYAYRNGRQMIGGGSWPVDRVERWLCQPTRSNLLACQMHPDDPRRADRAAAERNGLTAWMGAYAFSQPARGVARRTPTGLVLLRMAPRAGERPTGRIA